MQSVRDYIQPFMIQYNSEMFRVIYVDSQEQNGKQVSHFQQVYNKIYMANIAYTLQAYNFKAVMLYILLLSNQVYKGLCI